VIVSDESTLVKLGEMGSPEVLLMLGGLVFTAVLMALNVKGALLIGIFAATLIGIPMGVTHIPHGNLISLPPSLEPIFLQFDFSKVLSVDMLIVIFTFLFMDMFDTVGTLVGVASKAGMLTSDGKIPKAKQALMADAIGTTVGAILGTSTVTTYVESAAGVAVGGKTGLTAFTVAILFLLALFLAPVFVMIPGAAIAPALVLVGFMMISPIANINFSDFTEAFPAFLTIIIMPLTYSISEGIVFGMIAYVLLKVLSGKMKDISLVMVILAVLFVLKFFLK
jgi:AGZA family xanthine/uracil permease-like MFS transporter